MAESGGMNERPSSGGIDIMLDSAVSYFASSMIPGILDDRFWRFTLKVQNFLSLLPWWVDPPNLHLDAMGVTQVHDSGIKASV